MYESIADYYDEIFPLNEVRTAFIGSLFRREKPVILDVGCATGELALALSKMGHRVTGVDLNEAMIARALDKPRGIKAACEFIVKDMTAIGTAFPPGTFDGVLCFGNTLVHLPDLPAITRFFKDSRRLLKPGGITALQIVNYDRILSQGIPHLPVLETPNLVFLREYHFDTDQKKRIRFHSTLTLKPGGQAIENNEYLYPLTFRELNDILAETGWTVLNFYGNDRQSAYSLDSTALIAVVQK